MTRTEALELGYQALAILVREEFGASWTIPQVAFNQGIREHHIEALCYLESVSDPRPNARSADDTTLST